MAEILVSVGTEFLLNKLISIASEKIHGVWGVKDELTKLHEKLVTIKAVLSDAEKKQVREEAVRVWLRKLNDVAYDIDDLFDEFDYEELRHHHKSENRGGQIRDLVGRLNPSHPAHKIKGMNQRLDDIEKGIKSVESLVKIISGYESKIPANLSINDRPETSSYLVDSADVVGREFDKSKIIDLLINYSSNNGEIVYSVVRIVGIGGLGKTTLAQLVYKDKSVEDHFDIKMWACVSQFTSEKEIYKNLLISSVGEDGNYSSLDSIENSLKRSLVGERYLIVLDDVWNNGNNIDWEKLLTVLLSMGVQGSKIIMTARSEEDNIPSIMATGAIYTHRLEVLPEEECWSLFETVAFGHGGAKKTPSMIEIGKKIVRKCAGVPLAVKVLRGLMYSERHEHQWSNILKKEMWDLDKVEEKIISVLRLSYDHLPAYLKPCFSYCSIFPKGHCINKKTLIQLWLAEGFLDTSKESKLLENINSKYFDILLQNSFLLVEDKKKWGDVKSYKMHDLVHDLALSIVGAEFSLLDASGIQDEKDITKLRRVRIVLGNKLSTTIPEVMYKARKLRTIVTSNLIYRRAVVEMVSNDLFRKLICLRVLDLSYSDIQELPTSIGELKHLRYLDLSHTKLHTLPDSCTKLYHLQTLKLICCYYFEEFPKYMSKLVNLRYLMFSNDQWTTLPIRMVGKLTELQKLSKFCVGKDKGFGIEELKDLNLLGGKLEIHNLENVKDATGANLNEKQYICCLELRWKNTEKVLEDDYAVLEGLQPHQNLKNLRIYGFAAVKFSTWMMSSSAYCLPNLISVTLQDCRSCQHLPTLGQLRFLKFLKIRKLKAVKCIGSEFYGSNDVPPAMGVAEANLSFPSLEELYLDRMEALIEWLEDQLPSSSSFRCLEKLDIRDCSKLKSIPTLFPCLKTLYSEQQNGISLMSMVASNLASLAFIHINTCDTLKFLPQELLQGGNNVLGHLKIEYCREFEAFVPSQEEEQVLLPRFNSCHSSLSEEKEKLQVLFSNDSLYEICIRNCPALKSLPDLWGFSSLRMLTINWCKSLKSLPNGIQCLPALEELHIGRLSEELEAFPFPARSEGTLQPYFVSLRVLRISGWSSLKYPLPEQLQHLMSLQELHLHYYVPLVAVPEWLGNLSSLQKLVIYGCRNLKYLPSRNQMLRLVYLTTLEIGGCPLLEERCCSPNSDEVLKTTHIPNCVIRYIGPIRCSGAVGDNEEQHRQVGNWVLKGFPHYAVPAWYANPSAEAEAEAEAEEEEEEDTSSCHSFLTFMLKMCRGEE